MNHIGEGATSLLRAACTITADDLRWMVLDRSQLPAEVAAFELFEERELDNETMAGQGFGRRDAGALRAIGRVGGFSRRFAVQQGAPTLAEEPAEVLEAATVVHLFDTPEDVRHWIDEVFVREFREHAGGEGPGGGRLAGVELLDVGGFHDYTASLLVVHEVPGGVLASTVVDLRVGCLLGVAYVVAKQEGALPGLAQDLGLRLEQQIVRVVLGAA